MRKKNVGWEGGCYVGWKDFLEEKRYIPLFLEVHFVQKKKKVQKTFI